MYNHAKRAKQGRQLPRKAYQGDTKAMNNLGVCYERGIERSALNWRSSGI